MKIFFNTVFSVFYNYWEKKGKRSPQIEASYYMSLLLALNVITLKNLYEIIAQSFGFAIIELSRNNWIVIALFFAFFSLHLFDRYYKSLINGKKIEKYSSKVVVSIYMVTTFVLITLTSVL